MDLIPRLRQFKKIEADKTYRAYSKRMLFAGTRGTPSPITVRHVIMNIFEAGSAIVLAGLLLLLIVGGFSLGRILTPFHLASLEPQRLRAEAEAVDIQIQFTDLNYAISDFTLPQNETTTTAHQSAAPAPTLKEDAENEVQETPPLSIDEALKLLAE